MIIPVIKNDLTNNLIEKGININVYEDINLYLNNEPLLTAGIIKTNILKFTKKSLSNFVKKGLLTVTREIDIIINRVL